MIALVSMVLVAGLLAAIGLITTVQSYRRLRAGIGRPDDAADITGINMKGELEACPFLKFGPEGIGFREGARIRVPRWKRIWDSFTGDVLTLVACCMTLVLALDESEWSWPLAIGVLGYQVVGYGITIKKVIEGDLLHDEDH